MRDTRNHWRDYFYLHISIRRHSDRYHYHRTAWLILTFKYHFASRKLHLRPGSTSNSTRKMSLENVSSYCVRNCVRMEETQEKKKKKKASERTNENLYVSSLIIFPLESFRNLSNIYIVRIINSHESIVN